MVLVGEEKRLQGEVEAAAAATERVQAVLRQVGALRACAVSCVVLVGKLVLLQHPRDAECRQAALAKLKQQLHDWALPRPTLHCCLVRFLKGFSVQQTATLHSVVGALMGTHSLAAPQRAVCVPADGQFSCLQVQLIQSRPGMSLPELRETYAALQAQHREEFLMYNLTAAALSQVSCICWNVKLAQIFLLGAAVPAQAMQVLGKCPCTGHKGPCRVAQQLHVT